jgi:valyl-tRNA synthetase
MEFLKLTAPFTPFITEELYQRLVTATELDSQAESIHMTDYPQSDIDYMEKNAKLMKQMETVAEIINLGQSIRTQNQFKVRQPLAEIRIKSSENNRRDFEIEQWMKDLISSELNIKKVVEKHELNPTDDWIAAESDDKNIEVIIDTNLTKELKQEGLLRELSRAIQSQRKKLGLEIGDKVRIDLASASDEIANVVEDFKVQLANDVNASDLDFQKLTGKENLDELAGKTKNINNSEVVINIHANS